MLTFFPLPRLFPLPSSYLHRSSTKCYVTAELHDQKHQPDIKDGRNLGMPLDEFTNETYEGLAAEKEEVVVGTAKEWYNKFEPQRQKVFVEMNEAMKKMYEK